MVRGSLPAVPRHLGIRDRCLDFAGGPAAEVAIGWADVFAITAGVNRYELEAGGRDTVASVGLRIGAVTICRARGVS